MRSSTTRELEALIRGGRFDLARKEFRKLHLVKIPRSEALTYANLARRIGLATRSIRILNPIVRPDRLRAKRADPPATREEKIEYAAALRTLGAIDEASEILREASLRKLPQAGLQLAFCLISEWRYQLAIPLLEAYVRSFTAPTYAMYVGKLNLLEALIHERRLGPALALIAELERDREFFAFSLACRKLRELAAQLHIANGDWESAISCLSNPDLSAGQDHDSLNELLTEKWIAVARSHKAGRVTPGLRGVREKALRLQSWETVRDCDLHIAKISCDSRPMIHLYFGTPHDEYRERMLKYLDSPIQIPPGYIWPRAGANPERVFDLVPAEISGSKVALTAGQSQHRLLILLCRDLYKPLPFLSIFSKLFPQEKFHPDTSPNRVHQVLKRFRKWIWTHSLPWELEEIAGSFRLRVTGGVSIAMPREPLPMDPKALELARLHARLGESRGFFTTRDASRVMGMSEVNVRRLLRWAVGEGRLASEGRTNRSRYRWVTGFRP